MTEPLTDIGVNLTHDSFDADREDVIASAIRSGVTRMIVTGTTVTASEAAADLAATRPGTLYATAGIHPHHAVECDTEAVSRLRDTLGREGVVAVGECGLDYFRNFSPPADQRRAFEAQLELAADLGLPVFLHQRDAHDDFLAIVRNARSRLRAGVAHCFTGTAAQLDDYLDIDLHIGITGWICDERRGADLQAAVPALPADRLMVETDAPYLLPRNIRPRPRSRRNEPANLTWVIEQIATLRSTSAAEVARNSTQNAMRFFGLA